MLREEVAVHHTNVLMVAAVLATAALAALPAAEIPMSPPCCMMLFKENWMTRQSCPVISTTAAAATRWGR
jgi:hypothetical protein